MDIKDVEHYVNIIIPNIEKELMDKSKTPEELLELYNLYDEVLLLVAPYDFISFNKALEFEEDKSDLNKGFYHHRQNHIGVIFQELNNMEVYDMYDMMLISLAPRVGKSTVNIRFEAWIAGRHPENTQMATSYSDSITGSFYAGFMEIITNERYNKIFPDAVLVNQNAKKQEIWLKQVKRYPTISFISIGGSMTGRGECGNYLFCDDLVSGIEQALSITRMENLWQFYSVNARQRKKDGAKEIHISTRWSLKDPISRLAYENADNPRCKIISIPCYDENGESNFNFNGGFSTKYYNDMEAGMDSASFGALYLCEPVEREGLLYQEDEMQYYFDLPSDKTDTVIAVVDSKNLGKDYVASPIAYMYGDLIYIEDVVYNNGLPEVTRPLVANKWVEHKVVRGDCESNNGGNYYADDLNKLIKAQGGATSVRTFFTGNNKDVKIITYADFVKKKFIFKDKSMYSPNSEYAQFMKNVFSWTQMGKNKFDDAPDSLAMLAQLIQDMQGNSVKILDRKRLGL